MTAAALLSHCAYLREVIGLETLQPKVRVVDISLRGLSAQAAQLLITLTVDNPNDFELHFSNLTYELAVGTKILAKGQLADGAVVPARGQQRVKLPLAVDSVAVMTVVHELLSKSKDLEAVVAATAEFETPFGAMDVDFVDRRSMRAMAGF